MSDGHTERGFGYWLSIFANLAVVGGIVFLGLDVHYQYRQRMYDEVEFSSQRDAWRKTMVEWPGYRLLWCRERGRVLPRVQGRNGWLPDGRIVLTAR